MRVGFYANNSQTRTLDDGNQHVDTVLIVRNYGFHSCVEYLMKLGFPFLSKSIKDIASIKKYGDHIYIGFTEMETNCGQNCHVHSSGL